MTPPQPLDSLSRGSGQQYSAKKKTIYSKSGLEQNKGLGCRTNMSQTQQHFNRSRMLSGIMIVSTKLSARFYTYGSIHKTSV